MLPKEKGEEVVGGGAMMIVSFQDSVIRRVVQQPCNLCVYLHLDLRVHKCVHTEGQIVEFSVLTFEHYSVTNEMFQHTKTNECALYTNV